MDRTVLVLVFASMNQSKTCEFCHRKRFNASVYVYREEERAAERQEVQLQSHLDRKERRKEAWSSSVEKWDLGECFVFHFSFDESLSVTKRGASDAETEASCKVRATLSRGRGSFYPKVLEWLILLPAAGSLRFIGKLPSHVTDDQQCV